MKDLAIDLDSHQRAMSTAAKALSDAAINIEGLCGPMDKEGESLGHLLFERSDQARRVLEEAGLRVAAERDVVVVPLVDRPGALWDLLQVIGPRSYDLVYVAAGNRLVLGGQGIDEVARILGSAEPGPGGESVGPETVRPGPGTSG